MTRISCHTQQTWVAAIRRLAKAASTCRVAVAYCGNEGYEFFPDMPADLPEELRVIVDASEDSVRRGLTNPKGLDHLLGLPCELRSLKALHAKVLIFDQGAALVGSTNMSKSSTAQYQMGLELSDSKVIGQLVKWFDDELWAIAEPVDSETTKRLMKIWPAHEFNGPVPGKKTNLPRWRREIPQAPPTPSQVKPSVTAREIKQLLAQFNNNECPYRKDGG